eukprot:TRINITY_DN111849_c0_g1_i1.p1 TRINITY_DN111849_c0_g1~~TRINITY_DN111849_c0_g1_i1.p1  ORF type:complete len:474 (+),score=104.52 TRINITY_DN111849_c0_g1_i1:98-1423(+)
MAHMDVEEAAAREQHTCQQDMNVDTDTMLNRTKSHFEKATKIHSVLERLDKTSEPLSELQRSVSELSQMLSQEAEIDRTLSQHCRSAAEHTTEIDSAMKVARNIGEDLLEDMLMLDKLSNLEPETRNKRKKAINNLEALLDKVDSSKARLSRHQKVLKTSLEEANKQLEQKVDQNVHEDHSTAQACQHEDQRQASAGHNVGEPQADSSSADDLPVASKKPTTKRSQRPRTARPMQSMQEGADLPRQPSTARGMGRGLQEDLEQDVAKHAQLALPDPRIWMAVELPVQFEAVEDRRGYVLQARIPGLRSDTISLELGHDGTTFTVKGARLPTRVEEEQLRSQLAMELRRLSASPDALVNADNLSLARAYTMLGRGKFGHFEETYRLPRDVNTDAMQAGYKEGGILRIELPKHRNPFPAPLYQTGRQPGLFTAFDGWGARGYF